MKTSVYVPDELWQKVLEGQPEASASQLLQECLRSRLETPKPAYAVLSPELAQRAAELNQKALDKAVGGYQSGFALGLETVEHLTYDLLVVFAAADFDFERFDKATSSGGYSITPFPEEGDEEGVVYTDDFRLPNWWGTLVGYCGADEYLADFRRMPKVMMQGFQDAVRGAWTAASGEASVSALVADAAEGEADGAAS